MKNKKNMRRFLSGFLAMLTVLSTILSPILSYAADVVPVPEEPPLYEEVKNELDADEVVKAKDLELETGSIFEVEKDFTGLEIPDEKKVKITFHEAKNEEKQDFTTDYEDTYKAVYYVEPVSGHPIYQINRKLIVKEAVVQVAESENQESVSNQEDENEAEGEEPAIGTAESEEPVQDEVNVEIPSEDEIYEEVTPTEIPVEEEPIDTPIPENPSEEVSTEEPAIDDNPDTDSTFEEIADTDPLLHYYVDTITREIIISFLGKVQLEVVCSLLVERYHVNINVKEPTVIYLERPLKTASYTIHIEVPPNPFWASIGLTVTPLPAGSGTRFKSKVSLGYLNQSFQNAVMEGVRYGMEQGLYGWEVTDCEICFDYGVYYSPVSTPADFRSLAPIVLEQALKRAGTQLLEPYLSFTLFAPQEYISRAYNDAPKYCAVIESTLLKNDEVIFTGEIPARCIGEYRNDLNFYTNGRSVCLTELKGYQEISGEPVLQPRRPNSRLDKVRHMFQKIT